MEKREKCWRTGEKIQVFWADFLKNSVLILSNSHVIDRWKCLIIHKWRNTVSILNNLAFLWLTISLIFWLERIPIYTPQLIQLKTSNTEQAEAFWSIWKKCYIFCDANKCRIFLFRKKKINRKKYSSNSVGIEFAWASLSPHFKSITELGMETKQDIYVLSQTTFKIIF